MTSQATSSYLITPSLLNAWAYIWESAENVRESESESVSLEDKQSEARAKAFVEFMRTLNRVPSEPNEFMKRGIEFEEACYRGETVISPIIKGGTFQIVGTKRVRVVGMSFLMYGRLDVLKGGRIYDIKRVSRYSPGKYKRSYQHGFYMELFPKAYEFDYLAYDGNALHVETYYPDQCEPIAKAIAQFMRWLKANNLLGIYKEKWKSKS